MILFEKLKEAKTREQINEKMPPCLMQRFQKMMGLGICTCVFAIIIAAVSLFGNKPWLQMAALFFGMGALVIIVGLVFRYRVLYSGYKIIKGEVTSINEKPFSALRRKGQIYSFHLITDEKKMFRIPAIKDLSNLPIHTKVEVFIPVTARLVEQGGFINPSVVWGYSILEEPSAETVGPAEKVKREEEVEEDNA